MFTSVTHAMGIADFSRNALYRVFMHRSMLWRVCLLLALLLLEKEWVCSTTTSSSCRHSSRRSCGNRLFLFNPLTSQGLSQPFCVCLFRASSPQTGTVCCNEIAESNRRESWLLVCCCCLWDDVVVGTVWCVGSGRLPLRVDNFCSPKGEGENTQNTVTCIHTREMLQVKMRFLLQWIVVCWCQFLV